MKPTEKSMNNQKSQVCGVWACVCVEMCARACMRCLCVCGERFGDRNEEVLRYCFECEQTQVCGKIGVGVSFLRPQLWHC